MDGALASLITARQACADARTVEQAAREALDTARMSHTAAREALGTRTRAVADLDIELKSRRTAADRLVEGLDRWLAPVNDWRALPDARAWLAQQAKEWRAHVAARDTHAAELAGLRDAVTRTATELATCRTRTGELGTALEAATRAHANLTEERVGFLDGESVTTVEQRLVAAREQAEAAHHETGKAREAATNARTAAETRHAEHRKQHEDAESVLTKRELTFAQALTAAGIAAEDVQRVARTGAAALEAEARALALIDSALEKALAILQEREADLAQHEQADPPLLTGPDLAVALTAADAKRKTAAEGRGEAELKLRLDNAVRDRTAQLRAELERRAGEADVWLRLADLIGDAKGANLRRFAQGLTLDRLLEHANARLTELKPRFTLERGAGGDMLIQVLDNDMAGEVRGLHNLSGGERFLVSLSLALGLAEMSTAGGVKIESLFIDEGFGALDPESLGQAIALLEHLHATGRRVGVISHVEELKERIPVKIEVVTPARKRSPAQLRLSR